MPFDADHFAGIVVELLLKLLPAVAGTVEMVDGDTLIYRAASGSASGRVGQREKTGSGLCARCLRDGEPLQGSDGDGAEAGSMAVAPLFKAGRVVGVLKVIASDGCVFGSEQIQSLQLLAGLMSAALAIA